MPTKSDLAAIKMAKIVLQRLTKSIETSETLTESQLQQVYKQATRNDVLQLATCVEVHESDRLDLLHKTESNHLAKAIKGANKFSEC